MHRGARQSTAAQRQPKPNDSAQSEDATIQDEQEQEEEIKALRKRNASSIAQARNTLDIGVLTCLFITASQLLRHFSKPSSFLSLLALSQTLLLPLSLSPYWIPFLSHFMNHQHHLLVMAHLVLFVLAFNTVKKQGAGMAEIVRWALPEIMAGAVEIQRRSERDAERRLRKLQGMKYPAKGP